MKLLFDQNPSRRLVGMLSIDYPESSHVTEVGLDTATDAERMRAHGARERERTARLVDPANAPEALIENGKLRERVVQLEAERDCLWAQVVRLQGELRARLTDQHTSEARADGQLSGAHRLRAGRAGSGRDDC